jgi:hypothetical protein
MCAMPLAPMSMDSRVVGRVLVAAALLNVLGSETNDEDEREGTGEEGEVGGMGRIDASSSASPRLEPFLDEMVDRLSEVPGSVVSEPSGSSMPVLFVLVRGIERALSGVRELCFRWGCGRPLLGAFRR